MPIGPKHQLGEQHPEIPRQFTDREEFIGVFEQAASELPPREYKVLVYYGVGGIGKTSLRIELCRLLEEKHPQTMWTVLDFRNTTYRDVETALFSLRQELHHKYVVQFPSFDLAYAIFWQKSRPQSPLRQDPTELEALLEEGTLFANLMSIVGEVPIVSLVPKLSKVISKTDRLFREWWTKRGHRELYRLQEMEPAEIVEWLPAFWAADLKDYMERESRPAVLFMDTYEALWEGEGRRAEGRFFDQDEWVRELVSHLPEVLWVIAGREKLRWQEKGEEKDEDWRKYQHQHLVGGLAEEDARRFLASCGITEEALQEVIVEGSKGVPFYLDLSVDTYLQIKDTQQRDPSSSDFGRTPKKVQRRFLRYLDRSETETLKVLSVARFWDRELFESLIKEFNTGYSTTALPELRRFSFVQEEQMPGTWTIHPLMREALEEHLDAELRGRVHQYLFDYYNHRLEGLESTAISDVHKRALTEAFHHGKLILDVEQFAQWFGATEEVFRDAVLWRFLIPLNEDLVRLIEDRLGPEHGGTGAALTKLAKLYSAQGRYGEAEPLFKRVLEICEKFLGAEHPYTASALNNLVEVYSAQGRYGEAEPLYEKVLEISEKALGEEHPNTNAALNNLAVLYFGQGRYSEAEPLFKRTLGFDEEVFGPEHANTATALNHLADVYHGQGRYGEAEPLYKRALEIRKGVLGAEHPDTGTTLQNIAALYHAQGRYEEAEPLYEKALEIIDKILGAEHPYTAANLNNIASLYRDQERYGEAEPLYEKVLKISEKALGEEHPNTAAGLTNLAELYRKQGRYGEAVPLYEKALEIREKVLGPEQSDTIATLTTLAELYRDQGRYGEAEPLFQKLLEISEKALGEEHLTTGTALNRLANAYYGQGRYEEARPLFQRALKVSEKVFGPEHANTAIALHDLANVYYQQEHYKEAEPLYQRVLEIRQKVLGAKHPDTVAVLANLADVYYEQERYGEAEPLFKKFLETGEKALGTEHPDTVTALANLADVYYRQERYEEARPLFQRALEVGEKVFGPEHPNTNAALNNLANVYYRQERYEEAEPLYQSALEIWRKILGEKHPDTATVLNNLAKLYRAQGRYEEAERLTR
jgi:tetratricopeptide (TPR) repeat protein